MCDIRVDNNYYAATYIHNNEHFIIIIIIIIIIIYYRLAEHINRYMTFVQYIVRILSTRVQLLTSQ